MHGKAELGFVHVDGADRLARLYQRAPLRVLFPDPPKDDVPQAALVTTSGGLAGGDVLELSIHAGPAAQALVLGSAAEKVYRSTGPDTMVSVDLTVDAGAGLEYLPQETILFDGSRLRRHTRIQAAADSVVLAGEMLVFGRQARGESLTHGLLREAWEVRVGDRLVWADALHLEDDPHAVLNAPAGFDGAVAAASLVLVGNDLARHRDQLRQLSADIPGRFGCGLVGGVLVARWLDRDAARLRAAFGQAWKFLRHQTLNRPACLPRLWDI